MGVEIALIGLGNPGPEYRTTRHNLGFQALDRLRERWELPEAPRYRHQALVWTASVHGVSLLLAKPLTYMNRSGQAVAALAHQHHLPPERIWVLVDDFQLPLGTLRIRKKGSDGGHNGLASIIQSLGSQEFPRFRMGIGAPPQKQNVIDYVLGLFTPEELPSVQRLLDWTAQAVETALRDGLEAAMSRFNGPAVPPRNSADPESSR